MPVLKGISICVVAISSVPTAGLKILVTIRRPTAVENKRLYRPREEAFIDSFIPGGAFCCGGLLFSTRCQGGGMMESEFSEKARKCCSHEHDRLVEKLSSCDSQFETPIKRHRCYRVAARRSGRRSKKCILGD
jgi:hypothetical protein